MRSCCAASGSGDTEKAAPWSLIPCHGVAVRCARGHVVQILLNLRLLALFPTLGDPVRDSDSIAASKGLGIPGCDWPRQSCCRADGGGAPGTGGVARVDLASITAHRHCPKVVDPGS